MGTAKISTYKIEGLSPGKPLSIELPTGQKTYKKMYNSRAIHVSIALPFYCFTHIILCIRSSNHKYNRILKRTCLKN